MHSGLAFFENLDSWKPREWDLRNARARRYLPSSELILADSRATVVADISDYYADNFRERTIRLNSEVILHPESGVSINPDVVAHLTAGTGLRFNLHRAVTIVHNEPEARRVRLLQAAQGAVKFLGASCPIHTLWEQGASGRLSASAPAIQNMPQLLRPAWGPIAGGVVAEVDFQSLEQRIFFADAGFESPEEDYFSFLASEIKATRKEVKDAFNPMLHGQTKENLIWKKKWEGLEIRKRLEECLRRVSPELWRRIEVVRTDKGRVLQRRGAEVFFTAYEKALAAEGVPAGIPLHDGWIFPAQDEGQARRIERIFTEKAGELLGKSMPVKMQMLFHL